MPELRTALPEWNLRVYPLIYFIEVSLPELIIERFSASFGHVWYKHLPGDVLKKYREGRQRERRTPLKYASQNPLYYADFPDIAKILEAGKNWDQMFQSIFGRRDIFIASLRSIEEIRNKVAHNRIALASDYATVSSLYQQILNALGESVACALVQGGSRPATNEDFLSRIEGQSGRGPELMRGLSINNRDVGGRAFIVQSGLKFSDWNTR